MKKKYKVRYYYSSHADRKIEVDETDNPDADELNSIAEILRAGGDDVSELEIADNIIPDGWDYEEVK
jgi:hypothetical protein